MSKSYAENMQHEETTADKRSESSMLMKEERPIGSKSNSYCKLDEYTRPVRANKIIH